MSKKFDLDEYFDRMLKKEDENSTQEKSKILYYIDEEKRTVVAVMKDCEYDAIDILEKMGIRRIKRDGYNMNKFMINPIYRGKAKCAPDDIWDEEEGMRIARNRMLENYYLARTRALMRAEEVLMTMMDELGSRIDYSDKRYRNAYNGDL